jgi:deazaflavin-dependent oxidoreductase (nitroreductase family)
MKFADQRATFNRRVLNRVVRPLSGRVAMWSLIEHRGRRSGKQYRTPVTMFRTTDGVAIMLAYGEDRDWVRNVMDAGGGRVIRSGKTFDASHPRIVATGDAAEVMDAPWRHVVTRLGVTSALLLQLD